MVVVVPGPQVDQARPVAQFAQRGGGEHRPVEAGGLALAHHAARRAGAVVGVVLQLVEELLDMQGRLQAHEQAAFGSGPGVAGCIAAGHADPSSRRRLPPERRKLALLRVRGKRGPVAAGGPGVLWCAVDAIE
ncbi:MAG: hypothetical protein IPH86_12055 [bacterium]|nr:hypothetical protein [bacterium]